MNFENYIATIEGFPKEGISFKDVTPLMQDGKAFKCACEEIVAFAKKVNANVIVGPEARGFMFGCPVATMLEVGFVPVRKPGKLPRPFISEAYDLEYGSNIVCMHKDAIKKGDRVLIVDDLLATGGTVGASKRLVERLGGEVVGAAFIIELTNLNGRSELGNTEVFSLLKLIG